MKAKFDLSLIIPCFNEEQIFEKNIIKVFEVLDQTDLSYEIIFVDDKSLDNTLNLISKVIKKNPRRNLVLIKNAKNQGRGKTVTDGILKAKGNAVGFIDIDLEISADYIPRFVNEILGKFDAACAFRVYDFTFRSLARWFASKGYKNLRKLFLKDKLNDTEAGYKFFKRSKILSVLKKTKDPGWFWDTEIMINSHYAGLKIIEIPTVFIRDFEKKSTVRLLTDTINYLIKLNSFKNELKKRNLI